jgi:hypothetical protein
MVGIPPIITHTNHSKITFWGWFIIGFTTFVIQTLELYTTIPYNTRSSFFARETKCPQAVGRFSQTNIRT